MSADVAKNVLNYFVKDVMKIDRKLILILKI